MQPTPGDVHVNTPLTNISVAFIQDASQFVAGRAFPVVPVAKQGDRYYTYDRGYFNKDEMAKRAPGTESAGSGYSVDNTPTYFCDVYAWHHDIPDQVRANSDAQVDCDRDAAELASLKALIRREKLWVSKYFTTSKWTTDVTGVNSGENNTTTIRRWNDSASNPIEDVKRYKTQVLQSTGFEPRQLTMGRMVWDVLSDHPDIVDRIKYGQTAGGPAIVTRQAVAALMEIDEINVMNAIENTAAEPLTNVHAFIGGKHALLTYSPKRPGLMTPAAGYTFAWTGYTGAAADGQRIKRMRMEHLGSDRVEIEMAMDQKVVSADLGLFLSTVIA